jgi:hypothetical protein
LKTSIKPGDTQVVVDVVDLDWSVGDEIVVTSTAMSPDVELNERAVIKTITENTITVETPFLYNHLGGDYNTL